MLNTLRPTELSTRCTEVSSVGIMELAAQGYIADGIPSEETQAKSPHTGYERGTRSEKIRTVKVLLLHI